MNTPTPSMPTAMRLVLTHPLGCGVLMALMFSAQFWLPQLPLISSVPSLLFVVALLCLMLNLFTPALSAMVAMGGGLVFTLQATAVAALLVYFLPDSTIALVAIFVLIYAIVPAVASRGLFTAEGMARASDILLVVIVLLSAIGIFMITQGQSVDAHTWVLHWIEPLFDQLRNQPEALPEDVMRGVQSLIGWTLPGMLALSLWMMWGMNLAFSRALAQRYGFYQGDPRSVLEYQPTRWCVWVFFIALALANLGSGSLQYFAVTLGLLFGSVSAMNGIAVAHLWLRARGMVPIIVLMYIMIMFWSMIIVPFLILGLLDTWLNFRQNMKQDES